MKTIGAFSTAEGRIIQGLSRALAQGPKPESFATNEDEHGEEACIPNISPRERLKRLVGGVIPFVIALAILTWLVATDANRLWRLPLFFLFVAAATGYFQWRDKT